MSKIGIMGGTFNPIHNGHLALAEAAVNQFNLDKVIFMTSGNPPHKRAKTILDAKMRHKMVAIATKNYQKFEACDYEVEKEGYSYTVETLQYLKKENKNDELYLIIGADSLHNFKSWYRPRLICELCTLLIYSREGYDVCKELGEFKKEYYCIADIIKAGNINISSTNIRQRISKRKEVDGLLPRKVLEFIQRNKFYLSEYGISYEERIRRRQSPERFLHSQSVAKKAVELAKIYGEDEKKAYFAGIMHDCAKNLSRERMEKKCADYDVVLDEYEIKNPALIHAKLGEMVARYEFFVRDEDILNAIKWHTLGRPEMSRLEKIIYVADMIEDNRSFDGVERLREIAKQDIDRAVYECAKMTIEFNEKNNHRVHPMAYKVLKAFEN